MLSQISIEFVCFCGHLYFKVQTSCFKPVNRWWGIRVELCSFLSDAMGLTMGQYCFLKRVFISSFWVPTGPIWSPFESEIFLAYVTNNNPFHFEVWTLCFKPVNHWGIRVELCSFLSNEMGLTKWQYCFLKPFKVNLKVNFMRVIKSNIIIPNSNYQMSLQKRFEHFIPNMQITECSTSRENCNLIHHHFFFSISPFPFQLSDTLKPLTIHDKTRF